MSDPRMQSMHLESQPRREQFRTARQLLEKACGVKTAKTEGRGGEPDEAVDSPTIAAPACELPVPPKVVLTFYLKDGTNVYPLQIGMNSIGRLPDNDVVIRDESVSRRHCAIVVHTDFRCEVHDVASKNGTILNGVKIAGPTRMQSGDQIHLCTKKLMFVISEAAPAAV